MENTSYLIRKIMVNVLKLFKIIGSSLDEQGYPHKLIRIYKVSSKNNDSLNSFSSIVKGVTVARNLARNKIKSNKSVYIYSTFVSPEFLFETKVRGIYRYIGPSSGFERKEEWLKQIG